MDIKIIENSPTSLQFVTKIALPIANALRRIMMTEVPSMAIEDVVFIENSSPMYDEVLAHRLGLVPLKTDLKTYLTNWQSVRGDLYSDFRHIHLN